MIKLADYCMGREKIYPLTKGQLESACDLLASVGFLFGKLGIDPILSSGYRPAHFNKVAGGSARSGHLTCEAIDIRDTDGSIAKLLLDNLELLEQLGLYLEDPLYTIGWIHLQTRPTLRRVFKPY
jgi:hypothetical protein